MHTADSTPTEVALSKIGAARAILAGAEIAVHEGNLNHAQELVDKAGGKLLAASSELERTRRRSRFLGR